MILQIGLGTLLILATAMASAVMYWGFEALIGRRRTWLHREPHYAKLAFVLAAAVLFTLATMTVSVWIWALAFRLLGIFPTLEMAVYFALVSFTTLGFGDIILEEPWRLLSGMAAANGLLNFGMLTAVMVEALRNVRRGQDAWTRGTFPD